MNFSALEGFGGPPTKPKAPSESIFPYAPQKGVKPSAIANGQTWHSRLGGWGSLTCSRTN